MLPKLFCGLAPIELRHYVYDFVESGDIKNNFNSTVKLTGKQSVSLSLSLYEFTSLWAMAFFQFHNPLRPSGYYMYHLL
jgi:hypothetical protein